MGRGVTVGVIANPASGRDIRRLVSGAAVVDNAEKGNMVYRLMSGLGATGVDRVVMMPGASGISEALRRNLRRRVGQLAQERLPELEYLRLRLTHTAEDTAEAVRAMHAREVKAIIVLGGDGTHRIVAKHCEQIPLCALSTGTNNAYPELREATVAGLATGLVATGRIANGAAQEAHDKSIRICCKRERRNDRALVDVAVSTLPWTGAHAIWRIADISEIFVTFAQPDAIGLSAIAGLLEPVGRGEPHGLHVRLANPADAPIVMRVPIAPGLVTDVGVASYERMEPHRTYRVLSGVGSLALDGERELELPPDEEIELELCAGPVRIDVAWVMAEAAHQRALASGRLEPMFSETP